MSYKIQKLFNGNVLYFSEENGKLHREDGPAIEYADGGKEWYKNGELHREDGPAIERFNGDKYWYKNGKRHREDGPAVELFVKYKEWWLNGKKYGNNNDFTNAYWIKFIKTIIFY